MRYLELNVSEHILFTDKPVKLCGVATYQNVKLNSKFVPGVQVTVKAFSIGRAWTLFIFFMQRLVVDHLLIAFL